MVWAGGIDSSSAQLVSLNSPGSVLSLVIIYVSMYLDQSFVCVDSKQVGLRLSPDTAYIS